MFVAFSDRPLFYVTNLLGDRQANLSPFTWVAVFVIVVVGVADVS